MCLQLGTNGHVLLLNLLRLNFGTLSPATQPFTLFTFNVYLVFALDFTS